MSGKRSSFSQRRLDYGKQRPELVRRRRHVRDILGSPVHWVRDELSAGGDDQSRALILLATSIPYVAFVMWGTMTDLPEQVSEIPVVGKYAKAYIWLAIVILSLIHI